MAELIRNFREFAADRIYVFAESENERELRVYHKFGFKETGVTEDDGAALMRML